MGIEKIKNAENTNLSTLLIRKKNGVVEEYEAYKINEAAEKSAARCRKDGKLNEFEKASLIRLVEEQLLKYVEKGEKVISTVTLHMLVEKYLDQVAPDVGKTYTEYRSSRMAQAKVWENIMGKSAILLGNDTSREGLTQRLQNANADSTLSSTKKAFLGDYVGESLYEETFMTQEEKQAAADGYIYFHDKNGRMLYPQNCCLFRMGYVLKNGCVMNGLPYTEPKNLEVAFDVMGDLILSGASQQYGGFTVPEIDKILEPYAEKTYQSSLKKYLSLGVTEERAIAEANKDVEREFEAGFQGLEYKLNTVASSRGDYPFTTISLGLARTKWGKLASKTALKVRMNGQGEKGKKKPVLFPKIVFLFDKNLHSKGCELEDVFEAGLACSAKAMYPDWLSLTGEGYISDMYKKYGTPISPMGCRAFLSPWYERGGMHPADENDKPVFEGRFNLGVISFNLPMILAKARKENKDFYEVLDYYLNMIRNNHIRTYKYLSGLKAAQNPLAFCYGGFYGGNLNPEDNIGPVLKSATMSFGVTALNELQRLYNGKSIAEDGEFALEVMKYINEKVQSFKEEDQILYAIYGTPAENLSGKQVLQFRAKYGIVKNVSDRDYVSNSFHCHVTEKISPIEKQNLEKRFWELFNGGKIQYVRYPLGYNIEAMRSLILRAMDMGFYEGVNISLSYCDDCGYEQADMGNTCPKCGSFHVTQIDRMNGYLSYSRIGKEARRTIDDNGNEVIEIRTRFSPHMQSNIQDRISM